MRVDTQTGRAKSSAGVGSQKQRHGIWVSIFSSCKQCQHVQAMPWQQPLQQATPCVAQELQIMKVHHGACYTALNAAFQTELRPAQPSSEPPPVKSSASVVAAGEGQTVRAMVGSLCACTIQRAAADRVWSGCRRFCRARWSLAAQLVHSFVRVS